MIVRKSERIGEDRVNMRGGDGTVHLEHPVRDGAYMPKKCRLFAEVVIPAGASIGYHEHVGDTEFYYILEGEAILDDGKTRTRVTEGDTVVTGNGEGHSVFNESDRDMKMVACIVLD